MATESENNKRIAKNTLLLYVRLLLTIVVGLYTSRVVLNALGIEDYGIYNVVGGVVAMFSLFTNSLSAATSRFLTYTLGKQDNDKLKRVFSTSVNIQIAMAIIIIIIAEVLGFFFLNYLNIPENRVNAAHWVFHFAVITFAINLISVPYNATIVAHEKMSAFAYISILESGLKLLIAIMLSALPSDKLMAYASLFALVALIIRITYGTYCKINFEECSYHFILDKTMLKEMSSFAGWNLLGSGAYLFNTQGVNIITNFFFGVATNAARGVTNQVENIVKQFVNSFTMAINPQITKSYASGNLDYMHTLVCRGAKFSYLLMLFFVVPLMFEAETVLTLWLKKYPPEAPLFLQLSLIGTMFDMLGNSTANAAWATGNIKRYYIIISGVGCLVFPLSWLCFILGGDAYFSYVIFAIIYAIVMFLKVYIIRDLVQFPVKRFFSEVLLKIIPVTAISFIPPLIIDHVMQQQSLMKLVIITIISCMSVLCGIFAVGLTKSEKESILNAIREKWKRVIG